MLSYTATLDEIITHILYPVASQTARFLLTQLGLLEYMGNKIYINSSFHSPSRSYNEYRRPILNEPGFNVNMKLNLNPSTKWEILSAGQAMDARIVRKDALHAQPVLHDKEHMIYMAERYLPCGLELECRLVFTDKTMAYDIMTRLHSTIGNNNFVVPMNINYNYRIPMNMMRMLWYLAYLTGVKKECFVKWLEEKSNNQIIRMTGKNKRSKAMELVVNKHQFETYVATEYSPDEPELQSTGLSADKLILPFSSYVQFARPNMLYLEYPIVVNNSLVPEQLVTIDKQNRYIPFVKLMKHGYKDIDMGIQAAKQLLEHPIRNPWYDVWYMPKQTPHKLYRSVVFFIGLFTLDEPECHCNRPNDVCCCPGETTVNIEDLDKYVLSDTVLDHFKTHKRDALDIRSLYNLSVFVDDVMIDRDAIKFDGANFTISNKFGKHRVYRFVLSKTPPREMLTLDTFFMLDVILEVNREK